MRFPLAPLEDRVRGSLSVALGVDSTQVVRWRQYGLAVSQADLAAVTVGFHPASIWPGWFDQVVTCARAGCDEPVAMLRDRHCSQACYFADRWATRCSQGTDETMMA